AWSSYQILLSSLPTRRSSDLKSAALTSLPSWPLRRNGMCASRLSGTTRAQPVSALNAAPTPRPRNTFFGLGVGAAFKALTGWARSEEHTSELQSRENLVCRLL